MQARCERMVKRKKRDGCGVYGLAVQLNGFEKHVGTSGVFVMRLLLLSRIFYNYILNKIDNEICRFHL